MSPVTIKAATPGAGADSEVSFEELLLEIRARRTEFSAQRQFSEDIVRKLKAVGIYRALVARRFGGDEVCPADFLRMI